MKTTYLIKQIESTPWESKVYGYIREVDENEAEEIIENLNKYKGGKSLGWDNRMYPIFELERINEVKLEFCKIIEKKNTNKSYKITFKTVEDLSKTLISMGLEDQFYIADKNDPYPGMMAFKVGDYSISPYDSNGKDRIAIASELHTGDYLIYEENL